MTMTKEQYIVLRKSGKRRNDVQKENFSGNATTFKIFLEKVGLLSLETVLIAMRDFQPSKTSEQLPFEPTKQEVAAEVSEESKRGRKFEHAHVTKEFIEAAFAQGKTAGQIEREEGMKVNTIFGRIKKWGIVNPKSKSAVVQGKAESETKQTELAHENAEIVQSDKQDETPKASAKEIIVATEAPQTKFIYFQIPIIEGYEIVDRGFGDIFGALQLAATRNIDLVRSAEELFMVMQRYTQLLHEQMERLIVEGDPAEHVQKFIQKHNMIHINKQTVTQ